MRILHVITTLDTGGAERLMVDLLPILKTKGDEVDLLLFNGFKTPFREELEKKGVRIHELSNFEFDGEGSGVYNPLHIFRLVKYIKAYDIIHTHNTACQLFVPIVKCLTHSKVKLATTEHNTTNRRRSIWWIRPIDKWLYSQYDRIICIGDKSRENLEQYLGNKRSRICVISNGVDIGRFLKPIKDVSRQDNFVVTMVAGFRDQKDQDTLLRAFTHLPGSYRLQLVGSGVREDALRALTRELRLDDRVAFMGMRSDVPEILEQSDVVVLSSHWEGLSLSSVEGMASGRPFVASDVDGLREIVAEAGVLFPHGDDVALAREIQRLCEDPELYRTTAVACQERAKQYDISVMAEEYNKLYKSLMGQR